MKKFFNNAVIWREYTMISSSVFLYIISSIAVPLAFISAQVPWNVFMTCAFAWFSCAVVDVGMISSTPDIEAIAATPLGIEKFLHYKSVFLTFKSFISAIIVTILVFVINGRAFVVNLNIINIIFLLLSPFLFFQIEKFINAMVVVINNKILSILRAFVYMPLFLMNMLVNIAKDNNLKDIITISEITFVALISFIANKIFFKVIPKDLIKSHALKNNMSM